MYIERTRIKDDGSQRWLISNIFYGEFDPGSERTLAAWIRHASRTLVAIQEWRKGEEQVSKLPSSWE